MNSRKKRNIWIIAGVVVLVVLAYLFVYMPYMASNYLEKANNFYETKDFSEAYENYVKFYKYSLFKSNIDADVYDTMGVCAYNSYQYDDAIKFYGESLDKEYSVDVQLSLANTYRDKGELEQAISIYNELIGSGVGSINIYKNLISTYLETDRVDDAIKAANLFLDVEKEDYPNFKKSGEEASEMIQILREILEQAGDEASVKLIDSINYVVEK